MSIETISNLFTQLDDLSPAALIFIVLLGVNLLLRRTPGFPNWLIPWLSVVFGMGLFACVPLMTHVQKPLIHLLLIGFIAGLVAAIGYFGVIAFAEKKWPWLHGVLNPEEVKPPVIAPPTDETTQDK